MWAVSGELGIGAKEYNHQFCNSAINKRRGLASIILACFLGRVIIILSDC